MFTRRAAVLLTIATAGAVLTGACSSSGGSGGSSGSGNSGAKPAATGKAISAQTTSLGKILVDGRGRTVYIFANDKMNVSTCDGACAADWPPVQAPSRLPASVPGVTGALGTATRSDGSHQLTVAGHPLYNFSGDSAPGQPTGQGLTLNGGLWTVASPAGAPAKNAAGAPASTGIPGY